MKSKLFFLIATLFAINSYAVTYKVDCRDAASYAYWRGWKFEITSGGSTSCMMNVCSLYAKSGVYLNSNCTFKMFGNKLLSTGWKFIAYQGQLEGWGIDPLASKNIVKSPASNTSNIETIIQVNNKNPNKNDARYDIRYIILDGPAGTTEQWKDAFKI